MNSRASGGATVATALQQAPVARQVREHPQRHGDEDLIVIMKASNALAPMAQRTSQMIRPKVVARTTPMPET